MSDAMYDVVGIGNAIVDVIAQVDDSFITDQKLPKGGMTLINEDQAEALYAKLPPSLECSGGSVANSIAGIAALGGRAAYLGRVHADQLGEVFRHDITSLGVVFPTQSSMVGPTTARCLVMVTPDAQRTMATYLGACVEFGPGDLDAATIASSQILYIEGYLWDPPEAKAAIREAASIAHVAGREVALSLSDAFCVNRHRAEFVDLIDHDIDILFCNEVELKALAQTDDFDAALASLSGRVKTVAATRSEHGSVVMMGGETVLVGIETLGPLVDTTGAGDLYAAGFLFGYSRGWPAAACGRLAALAAAEVISHIGARPHVSLRTLAQTHMPDYFRG